MLSAALAGCRNTAGPTPLQVPVLACPAQVAALSVDGNPVLVNYPAPTATGGEAPLTTSCVPAAGQTFAMGTTLVSCTARDARQQTTACSFPVTVTLAPRVPRLLVTKFMAFGDSITEGASSTCSPRVAGRTLAEWFRAAPTAVNDPWNYPNRLQAALRATYPAQASIVVANQGVGSEVVDTGVERMPSALTQVQPDVVLLQEGANDVNQGEEPESIAAALRSMVRTVRGRGAQVVVGTLLPQRRGACKGYAPDSIVPANDQIRAMAASEGVPLVDLYQVFGSVPGDLIGVDGLHPSEAGYQKIADAFFAAIRQRYEQ